MRTVFSNNETMHVWASQTQEHGRSGNGNVFFEGRSIYSYGHHFEMARFITPEVVLITTRSYSVTTSGHLSKVRRAVSHLKTFTVPSFTDHQANLDYLISEAQEKVESVKRKRSSWPIEHVLETFNTDDITQYAFIFGLTLPELPIIDDQLRTQLLAKAAQYRAREAAASLKREAENQRRRDIRIREEMAELEAWKRGETVSQWYNFASTALRVNGSDVETTHGAKVTLQDARRFYVALRSGVNLTGATVGAYTVRSVSPELVVIGCHNIPMSEIERIEGQVMSSFAVLPEIKTS